MMTGCDNQMFDYAMRVGRNDGTRTMVIISNVIRPYKDVSGRTNDSECKIHNHNITVEYGQVKNILINEKIVITCTRYYEILINTKQTRWNEFTNYYKVKKLEENITIECCNDKYVGIEFQYNKIWKYQTNDYKEWIKNIKKFGE